MPNLIEVVTGRGALPASAAEGLRSAFWARVPPAHAGRVWARCRCGSCGAQFLAAVALTGIRLMWPRGRASPSTSARSATPCCCAQREASPRLPRAVRRARPRVAARAVGCAAPAEWIPIAVPRRRGPLPSSCPASGCRPDAPELDVPVRGRDGRRMPLAAVARTGAPHPPPDPPRARLAWSPHSCCPRSSRSS